MASAKGNVVRIEESDNSKLIRIAQKEVNSLQFALERATIAEQRAIVERERLESELELALQRQAALAVPDDEEEADVSS